MRTSVGIAGPIAGLAIAAAAFAGSSAIAQPAAPSAPCGMHQAMLARAAANLGVPEARLADALRQAHDQGLDDEVKAGHLTQAQADAMRQRHRDMEQGCAGMMGAGGHGGPGTAPTTVAQ